MNVEAEEAETVAWLGARALEDILGALQAREEEEGVGGGGGGEEEGTEHKESKDEEGWEGQAEAAEAEVEVEHSVRTARVRRQAALGKHQDADVCGYESEIPGLMRLRLSALGYQPGGISMGGKAAIKRRP